MHHIPKRVQNQHKGIPSFSFLVLSKKVVMSHGLQIISLNPDGTTSPHLAAPDHFP